MFINKWVKRLGIIFLGAVIVVGGLYIIKKFSTRAADEKEPVAIQKQEDLKQIDIREEKIQEVIQSLQTSDEVAQLKTQAQVLQRKVSLVFTGLALPEEMEGILKILEAYDIKAIFLIDGMSAAEDPESVVAIKAAGHEIGNYGYDGKGHLEEKSREDIAISFAYAQEILKQVSHQIPQKFASNATIYTEEVLNAAYHVGLTEAIKPSSYIAQGSFNNFAAAMGYVSRLAAGDIIGVKLNAPLDEIEYEPFETDARPETDFEEELVEDEAKQKVDIVKTTQYLIEALRTTDTPIVPFERLYINDDKEIESIFTLKEDIIEYAVPEGSEMPAEYLENALFIGDSLTQTLALSNYPEGVLDRSKICAYKSITIDQILNNVTTDNAYGEPVRVLDEILSQTPDKIYILLGTNSFSISDDEAILNSYSKLIEVLKEKYPEASIIIQGLPPVSKMVSIQNVMMTKGRILKYNLRLAKLAEQKGCYYVDLYSAFCDEAGDLPDSLAQEDGVHLKKEGCKKWLQYILTHAPKS